MIRFIESVLSSFRKCFSRNGCFKWFAVIVAALMLRGDKLGVTSFIRDLDLSHKCYENLLHFFHSGSYLLSSLRAQWYRIVLEKAPIHKVEGRAVLIGDGVKQSKEALRMPGVKKMVQESETSSKPEYIHGHLFGVVGIIISGLGSMLCLPLKSNIQDGLRAMASWPESEGVIDISGKSHVEQIIEAGFEAAKVIGRSFLVLDRYFLSRPALEILDGQNSSNGTPGDPAVVIVTKGKANCTAYRHPRRKAGAKGRPPKKGKSVKLASLFTQKRFFKEAAVKLYGNDENVSYYCLNLLWGQGLYRELRFVLVKYRGRNSILVSTDTALDPLTIIGLYGVRFSIEESFREFKQQIGGFGYHFWTSSMPKLNHFAKKGTDPLESLSDSHSRKKILETIKAIEAFVFCSSVAMGILQMLALNKKYKDEIKSARYLRTASKDSPSEATVMYYFRKRIFYILARSPQSFVTQFIREKQLWGLLDENETSEKEIA